MLLKLYYSNKAIIKEHRLKSAADGRVRIKVGCIITVQCLFSLNFSIPKNQIFIIKFYTQETRFVHSINN